jgi:hypothetical protein
MVVAEGLASMVLTGMMKPSLSLGIMVWSCQAGTYFAREVYFGALTFQCC